MRLSHLLIYLFYEKYPAAPAEFNENGSFVYGITLLSFLEIK